MAIRGKRLLGVSITGLEVGDGDRLYLDRNLDAFLTSCMLPPVSRQHSDRQPCYDPQGSRQSVLAPDEIAVWWLATDAVEPADLVRWFVVLNAEERERSARFFSDMDRREFIAAHALLRRMLTAYLNLPSHLWRFAVDPDGKPKIDAELGVPQLPFNLSHTRGLVAAALALRGVIGVDVEKIEPAKADLKVAENYFAPSEIGILRRASAADRPACFFRIWTLKEAYIKAIGTGLGTPLDSFSFSLEPPCIDFAVPRTDDSVAWQFATLPTTDQHVLSVAAGFTPGATVKISLRAIAPQYL
jgi:4'-phosphopantetheinyl transferase